MKKITNIGMAALVAMGMLGTSCNKVESQEMETPATPKDNIVTLTTTVGFAEADTKALAIDYTAKTLTKTFKADEKIAVVYENTSGTMVKAESEALTDGNISADGKSATFTVTLTDPKASGTVKYIYPAAMAGETDVDYSKLATQDGTLTSIASNFDLAVYEGALSAEKTLPASPTLTNGLALIAYTIYDNADTPADLTDGITGMTVNDGTNTYTITGKDADGHFYAAIRPTSGADIEYTATDGNKDYTKSVTGKTYAAGEFYQQGLKMEALKPYLLSDVFSVSDSKTVKFSKGNLRYASGTWSFFNNQYDYYNSYSEDAWDKFGWSTSITTYGMNTSTVANKYKGDFVDWGATMGTGWFTLSRDEWTYLFNTRGASTVGGTADGRYAKAKVNGVQGVILFPDTYTHPDDVTAPTNVNTTSASFDSNTYTVANWTKMESAGCVFLPATGLRSGSTVNDPGNGYYWSATPNTMSTAYGARFTADALDPALTSTNRSRGYSVRLVREVTE